MNSHGPQHEELLLAFSVGEVSIDDPRIVQRRAACALCAESLRELGDLTQALDEDAAEEREILELAAGLGRVPSEDQVLAFEQHPEFHRPGGTRAGTSRRWILVAGSLAAAAALVVGVFLLRPDPVQPLDQPRMLAGDEQILCITPLDSVKAYAPFRWELGEPLEPVLIRSYALVIEGVTFSEEVSGITNTRWNDPEIAATFPNEIEWWVEAYDATGAIIASSDPVRARRLP